MVAEDLDQKANIYGFNILIFWEPFLVGDEKAGET